MIVALFTGIFSGAGVVISKYFGAGDIKKVQTSIHTSVAFGIISGVIMTILGTVFAPVILRLMGTPSNVLDKAIIFVRIYFSGIITVVLYNTASGIYQAIGDSKRPLYYLIISSILNVIFWAYPLTWTLSSIIFLIYYLKSKWLYGFEKSSITL